MRLYQRVRSVLAREGVSGLLRRGVRKLASVTSRKAFTPNPNYSEDYDRLKKKFVERALSMGHESHGDLMRFMWYHTINLGNGLITPGTRDYRKCWPAYRFPTDMRGMNVLDVGSATGFFSFEFEKRGADVTSVDLPSIADWDMIPWEAEEVLRDLMAQHQVSSIEELHYYHLDGPFEFCRKVLNSKVKRCHSTIYDLSAEKLGTDGFDLVFIGDVLLHVFSPLEALVRVAPLCRKTLVLAHGLPDAVGDKPLMQYRGGESPSGDNRSWWVPNRLCFEQMLKRVGFKAVSEVGRITGVVKCGRNLHFHSIIHATK